MDQQELQPLPRGPHQGTTVNTSVVDLVQRQNPLAEMPGPGLKRDYAGALEYWQMIRRHKTAVVFATLFGGLIGFCLTLPDLRVYQSRTTLEIQGLNEDFLNMRNVNPTVEGTSASYPDIDIQTQVRILQSRTLLNRVRDKLRARERPNNLQPPDRLSAWRKALKIDPPAPDALWNQALAMAAGNIKVKSSATNRIVEVSCDSTNPQLAAEFVNTLAEEYIEQNLEARWKSTEHTGEWLTKQLQDLKIKLEKSEEEMQHYASSTGLIFMTGEKENNNVDESKLADLQKELSSAQADRVAKQSKYEMTAASPADSSLSVLDDVSLQASQKSLDDLKGKLAQLRITFTPNHPEVRRVQVEITNLEIALQRERGNILTRVRNDYEAAQRREKLLVTAYESQAHRVSGEAEKAAHYNLLKREVDSSRTLYEAMLQKLKEASIASALRASNIRVVDAAEASSAPYKPDVSRQSIVGLLSGLFLGVVLVVFRERADRTLQDPGDPAYYLNLPELGVVPVADLLDTRGPKGSPTRLATKNGGGRGIAASADDRIEMVSWSRKSSLLAESFRTTLTSILFSGQNGERPRVLVLTSASPKEGKTTVVSNLGISLAEINQSVLLIDADMRRPRLHTVFGAKNGRGLSDLLLEKVPLDVSMLEDAIIETSVPGLSLLTSGTSRHSASSLLHSNRLPELIKLARERFDSVVIDTPPMVNISDARVMARYGDALILIVRSASTTRDAALLAKRRFAEDGIPILGTILNLWNPKTPGYGYYKYYYAGYYHYYGNGNGTGNSHGDAD